MRRKFCLLVLAMVALHTVKASGVEMSVGDRIRSFYQEYKSALNMEDTEASISKCDSLIQVYCTDGFRQEVKDEIQNGVGYDFVTDDNGMDDLSLATLSVEDRQGYHIVSFQVRTLNSRGVNELRNVRLKIELENGKINKVTDMNNP